jgi:predicted dinucleotide-utilizing enzyme
VEGESEIAVEAASIAAVADLPLELEWSGMRFLVESVVSMSL